MSVYYNDHPISDALSGSVSFGDLNITGWENALDTYTSKGIVYINKTASEVAVYSRLTLFGSTTGEFDSANQICAVSSVNSSGAAGASMSASNASGITGTISYNTGTGYCKSLISFCDESHVRLYIKNLSSALDSNSQHEGKTRFRLALLSSFNTVKQGIIGLLRNRTTRKTNEEIDLTQLKDPMQFREVQAMTAAASLLRNFAGPMGADYWARAQLLDEEARRVWNGITVLIDDDDNNIVDAELNSGWIDLRRR